MKPLEVKNWAQTIILRVQSHQPAEDSHVECKASWPDVKNIARQLAGHANAAKGEPVLWLIGVDEKGGRIPGAEHKELNNWYPQLVKEFEGIAPFLSADVNVDVEDKTVVALLFETASAPYVVRIANSDRFEIPWREGTRTRSATRTEVVQVLSVLHAHGLLIPIKEFAEETPKAQVLAFERPPYWEYLLTIELLKSKLAVIRRKYDEVHSGLAFRRSRILAGKEFTKFVEEKMDDLTLLMHLIQLIIEREIPRAWGAPGVPGDAIEIKHATDRLATACEELVAYEREIISVKPPSAWEGIQQLLKGFTSDTLNELDRLPVELSKPFESDPPSGEHHIKLQFKIGGDRIEKLLAETSRIATIIQADPNQWDDRS